MNKKEKLESLRERYKEIEQELHDISNQMNRLKKEIWTEEKQINVGDFVCFMDGNEEKKGKLHSIDLSWSYPKPKVQLFKKDGTLGTRITTVYRDETLKKLNSEPNPERSVATEDAQGTKAGNQIT